MRIILIILCLLLSSCENPNKTYIDIQTIDYEICRKEVLQETSSAYMVDFAGYDNWLPKNSKWIWIRGGVFRDKARFVPVDKVEETVDVWRKERRIDEKIFIVPSDYDYYQCRTWKYEGDLPNIIKIPNGEFWGLIRMYNIAGWEKMKEIFIHKDDAKLSTSQSKKNAKDLCDDMRIYYRRR